MATGGTIPANRTQSVRFYNTCGVVDKDKNVYLSPRFTSNSVIGKKVNVAYLTALEAVCPPSSAYKDIVISGWSPQDRTLVVRGNIDDFRLVTEEGACLNYLIVTRSVTKGLVTKTYYYGFFITGVEQSGGSSVRLTLEPDDFTNVFYLHNEYVMTNIGYEPFNDRMKNCHVNRQHYNRVVYGTSSYLLTVPFTSVQSGIDTGRLMGQDIYIEFRGTPLVEISGKVVGFDDSEYVSDNKLTLVISTSIYDEIPVPQTYSEFWIEGTGYLCDYHIDDIEWETVKPILPANERIFLNQDESFKFKYQYRDEKIPYRFSKEDIEVINNTNSFSSLPATIQSRIIRSSLSYLVLEMKSTEALVTYNYVKHPDNQTTWNITKKAKNGNLVSDKFNRPNAVIAYPFFDIPDFLQKYETEILNLNIKGKFIQWSGFEFDITPASDVFKTINQKAIADWIYSAYIVRDVLIPDEDIYYSVSDEKVYIRVDVPNYEEPTYNHNSLEDVDYQKGLFVAGVTNDPESIGQVTNLHQIELQWGNTSGQPSAKYIHQSGCLTGIMVSGYDKKELTLNLGEEIPDLKNTFYDIVLQAEPYSFYSISYLNYELAFNKNRYYSDYNLLVDYHVSINGAVKCGFIPNYSVEDYQYLYFNEGMVFTLDSALPLVSDSYSSYYYVNKAQMKNQFAVNDYNRGVDLAQHFFLSGPNAVGQQAFKRGGYGAIAETVNQSEQMIDEMIDWAQSDKVIDMNQKAKLADMGTKPDVVKQTGTDSIYDLSTNEANLYLNHYTIDEASYNSIAKFLERFGYQINLYDTLHTMDRVGWNYIKTNSFDWNPDYDIMVEQEENLIKIFSRGVTLLHNKVYLTSGHNYETILDS